MVCVTFSVILTERQHVNAMNSDWLKLSQMFYERQIIAILSILKLLSYYTYLILFPISINCKTSVTEDTSRSSKSTTYNNRYHTITTSHPLTIITCTLLLASSNILNRFFPFNKSNTLLQ